MNQLYLVLNFVIILFIFVASWCCCLQSFQSWRLDSWSSQWKSWWKTSCWWYWLKISAWWGLKVLSFSKSWFWRWHTLAYQIYFSFNYLNLIIWTLILSLIIWRMDGINFFIIHQGFYISFQTFSILNHLHDQRSFRGFMVFINVDFKFFIPTTNICNHFICFYI